MAKPLFKTDQIVLASALAIHLKLRGVEMVSPTKAVFCFDQTKETNELVSKFWSNELLVSPLVYQQKLKELKTQIVSMSSNGNSKGGYCG